MAKQLRPAVAHLVDSASSTPVDHIQSQASYDTASLARGVGAELITRWNVNSWINRFRILSL